MLCDVLYNCSYIPLYYPRNKTKTKTKKKKNQIKKIR